MRRTIAIGFARRVFVGLIVAQLGVSAVMAADPQDAANPLGGGASDNPLGAPAQPAGQTPQQAEAGLPAGYTALASTATGRALFAQKTDATTVQAALRGTLADLATVFDGKPKVAGAFADAKQGQQGGASFTGTIKGQAIKGFILCGIGDKGAAMSIVYDAADAPQADWAQLTGALPQNVKWTSYDIGNGAGSISLPADWKLGRTTQLGAVMATGPKGQAVDLGDGAEIVTPDNWLVKGYEQQVAQARAYGGQAPPPFSMFVAPYGTPEDDLKNLVPQFSTFSQRAGGPALKLEAILKSVPVQSFSPNGTAARILYTAIRTTHGRAEHLRAWIQIDAYQLSQTSWGIMFSGLSGPEATFASDMPIMMQISQSWKLNDAVVQQHTQQQIAQQNQRFAAFEGAMKAKSDAFDGYMADVRKNELIQQRSNDNFDEIIRGYRTVEDTETGDKTSVDLNNVDGVVNSLNASDPGRYIQIPLRDEADPLPGNGGQ